MKKVMSIVLLAGCMCGSLNAENFDVGISGSDRGISGFSLSIGDYYRVPTREIIIIERYLPEEDISVIYYLARHSHRSPQYISQLRLNGMSWWNISIHLGLDPHTLYIVDSRRHSGPPYGKAYGYYKEGKNHRLNDAEIVDLVNVKFLSSYHGVSVDDVIDRRARGQRYMHIDDDYRMKKSNQMQRQVKSRENEKQQMQRQVKSRENEKQQMQHKTKSRENQNNKQGNGNKNRDKR